MSRRSTTNESIYAALALALRVVHTEKRLVGDSSSFVGTLTITLTDLEQSNQQIFLAQDQSMFGKSPYE